MPDVIDKARELERETANKLRDLRAKIRKSEGKDARGGWNKKSVEDHQADGTYRADRHGDDALDALKIPQKPAGIVTATARSQNKWIRSEADARAVANGCRFNEALAEHAASFFPNFLCHSKGQFAGEPFELYDWQRDDIIFPLFGWVRPDGTRRYRRTYIEIPKKNGKSTLAAGIGIYMLIADEEAGAEIYSMGADRDQARVVHNEAINMIEASPLLNAVTKINKTTGNIAYHATKSWYRALSATPRGKHGMNIHCGVIDELHEWFGDKLWNAIKYGYRARRQPLQFCITNAGDDMESVCRQQHDKAVGIANGTLVDDSFFPIVLDVPEVEADEEIAAVANGQDTLPIAQKCNPALGTILKVEGLVQDVRDAVQTPRELPNLKRLTYGVWVTSEKAWLDSGLWTEAEEEYTEADLYGVPCWAGLDLGKTRDMSSCVLVFPREREDGGNDFLLLPYFWLPQNWADAHGHLASYGEWEKADEITLTPGAECDYAFIERDVASIADRFDLQALYFDGAYAADLTQRLEENHGIERVQFKQTIMDFCEPTAAFERFLIGHRLKHNGHRVLTWQAGHVAVKTDANGNMRPIKAKPGSYKAVDGIVAAIMGLAGAMAGEENSVYDERELIVI